MHTFGARLRAARLAAHLTQQRLGDAIGVSKGAVSRWESDQDQPQFSVLEPLRKALRVSLDHLICGDPTGPKGVAEPMAAYNAPDELEWHVVRRMRQMTEAQRRGLRALLDD